MDIINEYLKYMVEKDASDIYFTVGVPPAFRIEGIVSLYGDRALTAEDTKSIAYAIMNERQGEYLPAEELHRHRHTPDQAYDQDHR